MSLLIQEPPLQTLPSLAKTIGLHEAMVLQQLHYWVEKSKDGWVFNTYEQWQEQFPFWSTKTISRIFNNLEEAGYVKSKQGDSYYRVKYYTIEYEKVKAISSPKRTDCPAIRTDCPANETDCPDQSGQSVRFNSLDYTETTTKDLKDTASSQKSDEPDYADLEDESIKEPINSESEVETLNDFQNPYDNKTYTLDSVDIHELSVTARPSTTASEPLSKPAESSMNNNSEDYQLYLALCEVTDNNPSLQLRKVHAITKKLMKAGYSIQDLKDFTSYWQRDWRYIRDRRAPSPEVLFTDIEKSAKLHRESVQEDLDEQALKDMFVNGEIPEILRKEFAND